MAGASRDDRDAYELHDWGNERTWRVNPYELDMPNRSNSGEAGVDGPRVEAAAWAIGRELDSGYRTHWCAESQKDGGCEVCRQIARKALDAADSVGWEGRA